MDVKDFKSFKLDKQTGLLIAIMVALPLSIFVAYQYRVLNNEFALTHAENLELGAQLETLKSDHQKLTEHSIGQQEIIDSFSGQIENISSTVGTLDKLAKTDKELLKKYSKVYFLNENYVPAKLTEVDVSYAFQQSGGNLLIQEQVWSYLKRLMDEAREDDVELLVVSAFRSFDTQASLKSEYKVLYGAGTANQFSADQGYSEHQLGTAVDFTTPEVGASFSKFLSSPAYEWLLNNAYKYGFILSYPENNTHYRFEPWHWRFVGVSLAKDLHDDGKYFYDLDQREIDAYLIKLFD